MFSVSKRRNLVVALLSVLLICSLTLNGYQVWRSSQPDTSPELTDTASNDSSKLDLSNIDLYTGANEPNKNTQPPRPDRDRKDIEKEIEALTEFLQELKQQEEQQNAI